MSRVFVRIIRLLTSNESAMTAIANDPSTTLSQLVADERLLPLGVVALQIS
jgi:hypothetical protein